MLFYYHYRILKFVSQFCGIVHFSYLLTFFFRICCIMGHIGRTSEEIQTAISTISEVTSVMEMAVQLGLVGVTTNRESTGLSTGDRYRQEPASHLTAAASRFC